MSGLRTWLNKWSRKTHRWMTIATFLPLALVIGTGLLLQLKKDVAWVQPPTVRGSGNAPTIGFDAILESARSVPEAEIESWADVDRLDVRPDKGVVKVRANSRWEVQIDTDTAEVLKVAFRRSDLIESLHDGSFFGDWAKLGVFLPSGVILFGLWLTGLYLWLVPHLARRASRKRRAAAAADPEHPGAATR